MILILTEDYPSNKQKYAMSYVHTRNLIYLDRGLDVKVLSFRAKKSYEYEGISVFSYNDFQLKYSNTPIDLVISHAPNIKNHIRFIKKNESNIQKIFMVFHGHEVLKISMYYPEPYKFAKNNYFKKKLRNTYDTLKLYFLSKLVKRLLQETKLEMLFVSEWMFEHTCKNLMLNDKEVRDHSHIIHNSVHPVFIENSYKNHNYSMKKDIIVIRPFDNSKYGIDIVCKLAYKNPDLTFHIFGKGQYFKYNTIPENIKVINDFFRQTELPAVLNEYKVALMPTRLDSQGVMMCEMASFGIPLITSDIEICKEMLEGFDNVFFFNNELLEIDISKVIKEANNILNVKNHKFSKENTVLKEVNLIKENIKDIRGNSNE